MNKKENAKYMDVPIIQKGKIYKNIKGRLI